MKKRSLLTGLMLALLLSAAAFAQSSGAQGAQGTQGAQTDQGQAGAAPAADPTGAQAGAAGAQQSPPAQGTPASEPGPGGSAQQGTGAESQGPATTPTPPSSKAPAGGPSAKSGSAPSSVLAATDKSFIRDAALGNFEAEELGRLAAEKASSSDVKSFGQKLADDHKQANDALKQVASSVQYEAPSRPSSHAKSEKARLEKLSGAEFDREFLNLVVKEHQKDISLFERESRRAAAPSGLKSYATSTLQGLQDHLKMAQDLSSKLGAGSTASPGSPSSPQHP
jgi:putative membrane protein